MIIENELISQSYLDMQRVLHAAPRGYGGRGDKWAGTVLQVAIGYHATSILDYGCGEGSLARVLTSHPSLLSITVDEYDPAIPGKDRLPEPADLVNVTDVMEHIEPEHLAAVLAHIRSLAKKVVWMVISTKGSNKILLDGRNAHIIIQPGGWWKEQLRAAGFTLHPPPSIVRNKPTEWVGIHTVTLTVTCLYVRGEYPYTVDYVRRLHAMVCRWTDQPFRFVCLTDRPDEMPDGVEPLPIKKLDGFAPWTKLELFNPMRGWSGRMLYLDLDSLIVAPLAPIINTPADFAITDDPPSRSSTRTRDAYGRQIVRRFNSSVMVFDGGSHTELYSKWTPAVAKRLSGDQDWTGEQLPNAVTLPREWFPRLSEAVRPPWPSEAKVIFCKVPKNHIVAQEQPWFEPLWGAA